MIFKQNGTRGRTWAGSVGLLAAALITGGCGSKAKETATASEANPSTAVRTEGTSAAGKSVTTPTEVRSGDVDLLQNLAVGASATNVAFLEADKAWQEFRASMRPPSPPVAWETNQPGKAVIEAFQKESGLKAEGVAEKAREFYTRYPKHEMAPEAQEREQYFLGIAAQYGNTNVLARMTLLEDAKLKDPATPEEDRLQVRVNRLQRSLMTGSETNLGSRVQMLEKEARLLMKDFPAHAELGGLLLAAATQWLELGDLEKARKLATEISENGESPDVKEEALALVRKIGRIGKPLSIKFKAVDGREVDLAALKGKVVLVDFWATWCGPCIAALPHLQETYAKFQGKGFEIIGISLDKEKPELLQAIADKKIPWPQHFQEGGEANKIADEFEVGPIPAMWIVDKKGNLRDFNGTENLAEKVERFLAE